MPAKKTEWIGGPDDLDTRVVGPWVRRKIHHVDRLLDIFGTAMKSKWPHRGYVELFAGPGLSYDRGHKEFVVGSARRAIGRNFTHFAFVDRDPRAAYALKARLLRDGVGKAFCVIPKDCNDAIDDIRAFVPPDALSLIFVDPTAFQVRMEAVLRLVDSRKTDLLVTFHVGAVRRIGGTGVRAPAVDAFFGTSGWRTALREPRERRAQALINCYNGQLTDHAGYLPGAFDHSVAVRNSKGVTMYRLVLFSRHPLGTRFWRAAGSVDELGNSSLWDLPPQ